MSWEKFTSITDRFFPSISILHPLNTAVVEALADEPVRARLANLGQDIYPRQHQTPSITESRNREVVAHHQGR
jgi:hypothetical protein